MRYDIICQKCGVTDEIEKPMAARLPKCAECGGPTRRVYNDSPVIVFAAAGFYSTDVNRFEKMVGTERAAKFNKSKESAEKRQREGRQTPYEKVLEKI